MFPNITTLRINRSNIGILKLPHPQLRYVNIDIQNDPMMSMIFDLEWILNDVCSYDTLILRTNGILKHYMKFSQHGKCLLYRNNLKSRDCSSMKIFELAIEYIRATLTTVYVEMKVIGLKRCNSHILSLLGSADTITSHQVNDKHLKKLGVKWIKRKYSIIQ